MRWPSWLTLASFAYVDEPGGLPSIAGEVRSCYQTPMNRLGPLALALCLACGTPTPEGAEGAETTTGDEARAVTPRALGAPLEVPGTGVVLRTPEGGLLAPVGAAIGDRAGTFLIAISVAPGDALITGMSEGFASAGQSVGESVPFGEGDTATYGSSVEGAPGGAVARQWLIARHGDRGLALIATCAADDEGTFAALEETLRSAQWDAGVTLDPVAALGLTLGEPEGFAIDTSGIGALAYTENGAPVSDDPAIAKLLLLPLSMGNVPAERFAELCPTLLSRIPHDEGSAEEPTRIEAARLQGCQTFAHRTAPGGEDMISFVAIVDLGAGLFMVAGTAPAEHAELWRPRFLAAAQAIDFTRR